MPKHVDEVDIFSRDPFKLLTKCFRALDEDNYGWCGTNMVNSINTQKFKVSSTRGWGFCKKDCFPDPNKPQMGVPRYKEDVRILKNDYCENLVKKRLNAKRLRKYKVKPQILCVGKNNTYKTQTFIKDNKGYHLLNPSNYTKYPILQKLRMKNSWYIVGRYFRKSVLVREAQILVVIGSDSVALNPFLFM